MLSLAKKSPITLRAPLRLGLLNRFNEIWPTGGWGSIEYGTPGPGQVVGGRWKPLQHFLRRSVFAGVGAACLVDGRCYVRNDGKEAFSGALRLALIRLATGLEAWSTLQPLGIGPGAHTVQWLCAAGGAPNGTHCTPWATLLAGAGCTRSTCVLNANVHGPGAEGTLGPLLSANQQLLAPPGQLEVPSEAAVTAVVGAADPVGHIPVTVRTTATALLVTLTTLAPGVFSDNVFLLTEHEPVALVFEPRGASVSPELLRQSLRVVHLAQYL